MAKTPEALLARYLAERDEEAAEELVRRTRPKLIAAARRIVPAQDAEDVVHTAFLSLFHKGDAFDAPVMPWLVTAVVRIAYRHRARERRQLETARRLARPALPPTPAEGAARREEFARLRAGVDRLPAAYRDAVVLHHLEGLSTEEVAGLLGISRSAAKKRLERGRRLLLGSVAPPVAYPFLAAWWCLADLAEASAGHMGVIAMKFKTAAVVTGIVIAAGTAGLGVGAATRAASPERAPASRGERPAADPRAGDLLLEVEAGREREAALRRELDAARAPENRTATAEATPTPSPVGRVGVQDEALRLAVPPEALQAAVRAVEAIAQNRDDASDLIREVQRYGEDGFRAALAIVRGEPGAGRPQWKLLDETFLPGMEGLLLDTIDSPDVGYGGKWAAINTLAKADTPAVRERLVARIENEKDRDLFDALAKTLAELKEPRAAKALGRKLLFDDPIEDADWRPLRLGMLWQLGQMGGEDAVRVLRDFVLDLRVTDAEQLTHALGSLYLLDKPVCGEVASRILEEPRGKALSPEYAQRLRNFAACAVR